MKITNKGFIGRKRNIIFPRSFMVTGDTDIINYQLFATVINLTLLLKIINLWKKKKGNATTG